MVPTPKASLWIKLKRGNDKTASNKKLAVVLFEDIFSLLLAAVVENFDAVSVGGRFAVMRNFDQAEMRGCKLLVFER